VNLDSVREVAEILQAEGLAPKKRWGQNFLVDRNVREAIVRMVAAEGGEVVWEVGPGLGALTELLLERGCKVVAFEIDHGLVSLLRRTFDEYADLTLVAGDATETWPERTATGETPAAVMGNLPYSQAAGIIASFVESELPARQYLFMVQEEVADRMVARPATRAYSAFTVLVQARLEVYRRMRIQPGSFYPRPEVSSALVELRPRAASLHIRDAAALSAVTRAVFHARRKTVLNSMVQSALTSGTGRPLSRSEAASLLAATGIDPAARGETLAVARIVELANAYATRMA
jgi:16S rRNA (adenine1518-N6/adenine1519-N6)-dimethyltransferase